MHPSLKTHLDISTCHITEKDFELLTRDADTRAPDGVIPNTGYEFGSIIFVLHPWDDTERNAHILDVMRAGYSSAMVAVIKLAWELGAAMIRLDRDAELCEGLDDCSGECQ